MNIKLFTGSYAAQLTWKSPRFTMADASAPYKLYKVRTLYKTYIDDDESVLRDKVALTVETAGSGYKDYSATESSPVSKRRLSIVTITTKNTIKAIGLQIRKLLPR